MKITKRMGRACLAELADGRLRELATDALDELADGAAWVIISERELHTALAMCAAIAGVSPE